MRLPVLSGREVVRALRKIGYERDGQKGSHIILRNTLPPHRRLSVPNHKELDRGTLCGIIRQAGLTIDEFLDLLD